MYVIVSITKKKINARTNMPIVHAYGTYDTEQSARYQIKKYFAENPTHRDEVYFSVCRVIDNAND